MNAKKEAELLAALEVTRERSMGLRKAIERGEKDKHTTAEVLGSCRRRLQELREHEIKLCTLLTDMGATIPR